MSSRKLKTSFKEICHLPAYEELSRHWKSEIVVQAFPLYQPDSDIVVGMYHDPEEFVHKHMARWLMRMDLETRLPPPGLYSVKFKVMKFIKNGLGFGGKSIQRLAMEF